jgi:hypothetical protein
MQAISNHFVVWFSIPVVLLLFCSKAGLPAPGGGYEWDVGCPSSAGPARSPRPQMRAQRAVGDSHADCGSPCPGVCSLPTAHLAQVMCRFRRTPQCKPGPQIGGEDVHTESLSLHRFQIEATQRQCPPSRASRPSC